MKCFERYVCNFYPEFFYLIYFRACSTCSFLNPTLDIRVAAVLQNSSAVSCVISQGVVSMAQFPIQSATLKLLEEALSILDSNEQPGLLTDNSNIDSAFSKVCDELSLTRKEVINIKTAFVSFAAIAEIDNYALEKEGIFKMYQYLKFFYPVKVVISDFDNRLITSYFRGELEFPGYENVFSKDRKHSDEKVVSNLKFTVSLR